MNWDLISAAIFYSIVFLLIYRYRHKFEIMQKIFFVYKTKRGIDFMHKVAKLRPLWKITSTIAIPVSIFIMLLVGKLLYDQLPGLIAGTTSAGVAIVIPGIRIPGSPIFIPFWYGIISIAVLVIVHEMSHGIIAALEGIKIKSCGFGFLAILPLAFVELDEEQMKTMPVLSRLRVAASGSFGNILAYLLIFGLWAFVSVPFVNSLMIYEGVVISGVESGLPAEIAGIRADSMIVSLNGQTITNATHFVEVVQTISPGGQVELTTNISSYTIDTVPNPRNESLAYMGVFLEQQWGFKPESQQKYGVFLTPIVWTNKLLYWVGLLNLLIGIMNFLPIWFLDGGRIVYDSLGLLIKNEKIHVTLAFLIFSFYATLLLLNIIGPYLFRLIT